MLCASHFAKGRLAATTGYIRPGMLACQNELVVQEATAISAAYDRLGLLKAKPPQTFGLS
jgi:hypothetical protein